MSECNYLVLNWAAESQADERALTVRAKAGDRVAFESLVTLYEKPVIRAALRLLGNREDAREAAQEVFLRLFKYLDRFDSDKQLQPWLYRLTVNVCRDKARKRRREPAFADQGSAELELQNLATPAVQQEDLALADACDKVVQALDVLSLKERAAVVLRDIEGLSTGEVARAMRCTQMTVRSHLSRGRLKIKNFCDRPRGGKP